jgi:hypothetical protein
MDLSNMHSADEDDESDSPTKLMRLLAVEIVSTPEDFDQLRLQLHIYPPR